MFDERTTDTCEACGKTPATRTYGDRHLCENCEERAVGRDIDAWTEYMETDGPANGPDPEERAALLRMQRELIRQERRP